MHTNNMQIQQLHLHAATETVMAQKHARAVKQTAEHVQLQLIIRERSMFPIQQEVILQVTAH